MDNQSMTMTTLYGQGSIVMHDGKGTYTANNGQITVPPRLVPQLLKLGWSTQAPVVVPPVVPQVNVEVVIVQQPAGSTLRKVTRAEADQIIALCEGGMDTNAACVQVFGSDEQVNIEDVPELPERCEEIERSRFNKLDKGAPLQDDGTSPKGLIDDPKVITSAPVTGHKLECTCAACEYQKAIDAGFSEADARELVAAKQ
jgi:hypothetical protein